MKHLFAFLLGPLLLACPVHAQTADPVRQKLDSILANLDKSQVPAGRLPSLRFRWRLSKILAV